jgi:hypothetical protein
MTFAFVPDGERLVTHGSTDHSGLEIGPTPFVTTKSVETVHGRKTAAKTQIAVTNAANK